MLRKDQQQQQSSTRGDLEDSRMREAGKTVQVQPYYRPLKPLGQREKGLMEVFDLAFWRHQALQMQSTVARCTVWRRKG